MHTFLKKITFILLGFIVIASVISAGSLWALRKSSFYKPSFLVNSVEENQFDYIIIGASTGLTTLNTSVIDSIAGTNGINLSMDDTALSSEYLMLQHFIAQGKTTQICILAPSYKDFDVNKNVLSGNDYRFLMHIDQPYVADYYKNFDGLPASILEYSRWFPLLGVAYYNSELFYPSLQSLVLPKRRNRFDEKGNYVYPLSTNKSETITETSNVHIDFNNVYLKKIKALCEQHNIQLICYFTPIESKKIEYSSKEYYIINHSDLLKNKMYFFDNLHVDARGRRSTSVCFAEELKNILK